MQMRMMTTMDNVDLRRISLWFRQQGCDSTSLDTDGDSIPDCVDTDDDNDGTEDEEDDFPTDEDEDTDTDNDGTGDNADHGR